MKNQMTDCIAAQALYIDDFSEDELNAAKEMLISHESAFLSLDPIGESLRKDVITSWKSQVVADGKTTKADCDSDETLLILADLDDNVDVKNAIMLSLEYQDTKNTGIR